MKNYKKKACILLGIVLFVTCLQLPKTNVFATSEDVRNKLVNSIVLYTDSSKAYAYNVVTMMDLNNPTLKPVVKNGVMLVPISFFDQNFSGQSSWDKKTSDCRFYFEVTPDIRYTSNFKLGSGKIVVEHLGKEKEIKLDEAIQNINNQMYVPLKSIAEGIFGKKVFFDRGLAVLSGTDKLFDKSKDKQTLDSIIKLFKDNGDYDPGMKWKKTNINSNKEDYSVNDVVWNGKKYVAVGDRGMIYTSPNSVSWKKSKICENELNAVAWSGKKLVAVGNINGTVYVSKDGDKWDKVQTKTDIYLNDIIWDGNKFIAVGSLKEKGIILTSTDGLNWTSQAFEAGGDSLAYNSAIAFNEKKYVLVGWGVIYTSSDCKSWTKTEIDKDQSFMDVTWGKDKFVAVGNNFSIYTSTDGSQWIKRSSDSIRVDILRGVVWDGSKFTALGGNNKRGGTTFTSIDGIDWSKQIPVTDCTYLKSMASNKLSAVIVSGEFSGMGTIFSGTKVKSSVKK
jgi:hypothetical protein